MKNKYKNFSKKIISGLLCSSFLFSNVAIATGECSSNDNADSYNHSIEDYTNPEGLGTNVFITAEFKDTSITDTLDALSVLSEIPIIIHGDLQDKVTMNIKNKPFIQVLNNLSRGFAFGWTIDNGMIIVSPKDKMENSRSYKINYMDLEELKSDLKTFLEDEKYSVSTSDDTLTVSGSIDELKKVENLLKVKDVQKKQVSIQAKLIEINKSDEEKLGFEHTWNTYDSSLADWKFSYISTLTANDNLSKGKILARPTITTLNGLEATINLTDDIPILTTSTSNNETTTTVEYKNVGVILKVTPRINQETGYVTMKLSPSVSVLTKMIEKANVVAPQISTRQAETTVRIKSGETLIIGGLLKSDDIENLSKIPGLGDLPLLGKLFQFKSKTKSNTELIVAITPHIEGDELIDDSNHFSTNKKPLELEKNFQKK